MLGVPIQWFDRVGYSILYLPALIFGYLYAKSPLTTYSLTVMDHTLAFNLSNPAIAVLIGLMLVGAILQHNLLLLTFGREGPSKNPKSKHVGLAMMMGFLFGIDHRDVPKSESLWDYAEYIGDVMTVRRIPRFLVLGTPVVADYLLTYFALLPLYIYLTTVSADVVGVVLFLALFVFLANARISSIFPALVPPDAIEHLDTPEYLRAVEQREGEKERPRIRTDRPMDKN